MRLLIFAVALALASLVPVAAATAAGAGELSGTVTSAVTGGPLASAYVAVYATSGGSWVGGASTDHNGAFQVGNLASGSYDVEFSAGGYLAQYYNGRVTLAAGDPVSVTAGQNTIGVDATMQVSGAISGHVTDAGIGGPAGGVQVVAYNQGNQVVAQTTADAGGAYTLTGLVTGSYDVEFEPVGSQPYWRSTTPVPPPCRAPRRYRSRTGRRPPGSTLRWPPAPESMARSAPAGSLRRVST